MEEQFELAQGVIISGTGKTGRVNGVAEYIYSPRQYYVEYVNGHGDLVAEWFLAHQLKAA